MPGNAKGRHLADSLRRDQSKTCFSRRPASIEDPLQSITSTTRRVPGSTSTGWSLTMV